MGACYYFQIALESTAMEKLHWSKWQQKMGALESIEKRYYIAVLYRTLLS